jgi:hypothetical protein
MTQAAAEKSLYKQGLSRLAARENFTFSLPFGNTGLEEGGLMSPIIKSWSDWKRDRELSPEVKLLLNRLRQWKSLSADDRLSWFNINKTRPCATGEPLLKGACSSEREAVEEKLDLFLNHMKGSGCQACRGSFHELLRLSSSN